MTYRVKIFSADLAKFPEEILTWKLHFLCSDVIIDWRLLPMSELNWKFLKKDSNNKKTVFMYRLL